jgi:hypothetical protein
MLSLALSPWRPLPPPLKTSAHAKEETVGGSPALALLKRAVIAKTTVKITLNFFVLLTFILGFSFFKAALFLVSNIRSMNAVLFLAPNGIGRGSCPTKFLQHLALKQWRAQPTAPFFLGSQELKIKNQTSNHASLPATKAQKITDSPAMCYALVVLFKSCLPLPPTCKAETQCRPEK